MPVKAPKNDRAGSPSDFKMSFADETFFWFGEPRPDMPIIRWPDGQLCQPLVFYFGYLSKVNMEAISSMEPRAYMLREWFSFLRDERIAWHLADDFTMHRWRHVQKSNSVTDEQVEKKLRSVYHFYLHMPEAMPQMEDGATTPEFVGRNKRGNNKRFQISTKQVRNRNGDLVTVWSGSKAIKTALQNLTVPDNDQCDRVLAELRYPSSPHESLKDTLIDPTIKRERDWGMGRLMNGAGLRAEEVPDLKLTDFTLALKSENLLTGLGKERAQSIQSIADLAGDPEAQEIVLKALKHFEQKRRRLYIGVRIKGKGQKVRNAGFLIDLVYDLLTVIVWGTLEQSDCSTFDRIFAVNTRSPLLLTRAIIAHMQDQKLAGSIVNIGSINGYCGQPDLLVYSMSKGALMTMSRNIADHCAGSGIRVNHLNVGWTLTETEIATQRAQGHPDNWYQDLPNVFAPTGKILLPQEVAAHVMFWASAASAPITGQVYDVEQYPFLGRNAMSRILSDETRRVV